ncbi:MULTISPECIES: hypothetical protein [Actinomyces]|uniref:Uncharacterized protein n=1 Tax=Actinomyces viscosus TaxID=1656 RepID=A0ABT7U0U9_ACTVI|nr:MULTISPECIES: hypothetical protein [Actinomyces]MDM8077697.1 hypothetical protein [Actinomyces viscosus]
MTPRTRGAQHNHPSPEVGATRAGIAAEALGRRLLERAGAATSGSAPATPTASASPPT